MPLSLASRAWPEVITAHSALLALRASNCDALTYRETLGHSLVYEHDREQCSCADSLAFINSSTFVFFLLSSDR